MSDLNTKKTIQKHSEKIRCDVCDKELVKGSLKRHKETKHNIKEGVPKKVNPVIKKKEEDSKNTAEPTNNVKATEHEVTKVSSKENIAKPNEEEEDPDFHDCIELEEGELLGVEEYERLQPLVSSAELASFLPQDDSLLNEFLVVEQVALEQEFGDLFKSTFAEDMRRHSLDQQKHKKCNECDKTNAKFEKQREKMLEQDQTVRSADIALKNAEKSKAHLRTTVKKKEKEIDDITLKWQEEAESYSAEVTRLSIELKLQRDMVKALKDERDIETIESTKESDISTDTGKGGKHSKEEGPEIVIGNKCPKCDIVTKDKKSLMKHIKKEHRRFDCMLCPMNFDSVKDYNAHTETHLGMFYTCNKCSKQFKYKVEMVAHMVNPCTEVIVEHVTEHSETKSDTQGTTEHVQNTCTNCDNCKRTTCKVNHRNEQNISNHIVPVHRDENESPLCINGPSCRFLSQNRCNYFHPDAVQSEGGPWQEAGSHQRKQQQQRERQDKQQHGHGRLPSVTKDNALWCIWEDKCRKGRRCNFKHPAVQRRMGNMIAYDLDFSAQVGQKKL